MAIGDTTVDADGYVIIDDDGYELVTPDDECCCQGACECVSSCCISNCVDACPSSIAVTIPGPTGCCSDLPDAEIVLTLLEEIGITNHPCAPDDCTFNPFTCPECEEGVINGCVWQYTHETWDAEDVTGWCEETCGSGSACSTHEIGQATILCLGGEWQLNWYACQDHGATCGNCGCSGAADPCPCLGTMTLGCTCPTDPDVDWGSCIAQFN